MATSAWARIVEDCVDRIEAIEPTMHAGIRWKHSPQSRGEPKGRGRRFATDFVDGIKHPYAGTGEERLERVLLIATRYEGADRRDVQDEDRRDLIAALQPGGTYPSGAWGACEVRVVLPLAPPEEPEQTRADETTYEVQITYRQPAGLI